MGDARLDSPAEGLNANHARVLAATFAHLARSFGEIASAMEDTDSPLAAHLDDLQDERRAAVRDHLARIRERLGSAMRLLDLRPPERVPISRALHVALTHAQIALDEVAPSRLGGYGLLGPEAAERVATVLSDLDASIQRLATDLARPDVADLARRIGRLGDDYRERLARIERVVTKHGLVELRPAIKGILELLEVGTFEVAVFGRVSSGKSSLINTVLGAAILPVGATPITAVPTRVQWGGVEGSRVLIRFADGKAKTGGVALLQEYVTEVGNPGNRAGVVHAAVHVSTPTLLGRIALVDTPGVGSLAMHGTRETLGYLPRCDLGVLLVEASSALGRDEIDLLRRLDQSGITAQVVLSKADLVDEADREHVRAYFAHEIECALGRSVPVNFVSSAEPTLAKAWFASQVAPLASRATDAIADSATRKLAALQAITVAILRVTVAHASRPARGSRDEIERLALAAEGILRVTRDQAAMLIEGTANAADRVVHTAAHAAHAKHVDARESVAAALRDEADSVRQVLEADLIGTRARLREVLLDLSHIAGAVSDVPDLQLDLVSQPVIEIPATIPTAALTTPHWPAAQRRLASRIETTVGPDIRSALDRYSKHLRRWADSVLASLAAQVAAFTEPCRALARDGTVEQLDVAEDLHALERL